MNKQSFVLELHPFRVKVSTNSRVVVDNLRHIYKDHCLPYSDQIADYDLRLEHSIGLRRLLYRQSIFYVDEAQPFKPLPESHGFAFCEWGMNYTVALNEMRFTIIHSAVLAKGESAIIFPAPPGSGKSTLTTYLAFNGWRLLSDEMALINTGTQVVTPFVRPICLKNRSIELAKTWFPNGSFSTVAKNTHKGDVVHLSPPHESWLSFKKDAVIKAIVLPKFIEGAELTIYQLTKSQGFAALSENAFNFGVNGVDGFQTVVDLVEHCQVFEITYGNLEEVIAFLEEDVL